MMKWIFLMCLCLALSGCQAKSGAENTLKDTEAKTEAALVTDGKEDTGGQTSAGSAKSRPEVSMEELVSFLEGFESELTFTDMDPEEAVSYGEPLKDFYEFRGRKTEDGFGYVLAILKTGQDPLENSIVYGKDDFIAADTWNEGSQSYEEHYTFREINSLSRGDGNQILYLQPTDYVMPEELQWAFEYGYCKGEEGVRHLQDVMKRGVRFTPPDNGAYLSVERYEEGTHYVEYYLEYIPLTEKEEKEILESDEIVDPVSYGNYGIQFFVSQDTYEKEDIQEGSVTAPAMKIAAEHGKFQVVELSEIHDITEAELKMKVQEYDESTGMQSREWEETETITDPEDLKTLEEILSASKPYYEGKCPYTGVLTLTRKDGGQVTLYLATDSCDGFILGSHAVYSPGKEMTAQIWELFPSMRENTGWSGG